MNPAPILRLSARQWQWWLAAWGRLWWTEYQLRNKGMNWLMQQLNAAPADATNENERQIATDMHEAVRLAERFHPLSIACLGKSLVLSKMLQQRGISARLRIGVNVMGDSSRAQISPQLASHAWVELAGEPIGEDAALKENFKELSQD